MRFLTLDFETFYDKDYSLSKLTTEEYIRDPRFEIIGVSVKDGRKPAQWFSGTTDDTAQFLRSFDISNSAGLAHNMAFDGAILGWRLGLYPKMMLDTLSMARPIYGAVQSLSLAKLSEHLGVGVKGTEIVQALGKRRADFTPDELAAYSGYCCNDAELCFKLFELLKPQTTDQELRLIDATLRLFTQPMLALDRPTLEAHLAAVLKRQAELLDVVAAFTVVQKGVEVGKLSGSQAGALRQRLVADPATAKTLGGAHHDLVKPALMSNPQFADLLRLAGVEPPVKISPTTGKEAYAFAKTDAGLTALLEHDDILVQSLVAARLGVKSTIEQTRTERFLGIASRGTWPVALSYAGADTTWRWSGCLTGDTSVTIVRDNQIRPEKLAAVRDSDLVWDGQEFVAHAGVVASGVRHVIEYCGIVGTPDHPVLTENRGFVPLESAKACKDYLAPGGAPSLAWIDSLGFWVGSDEFVRECRLHQLRGCENVAREGLIDQRDAAMPELFRRAENAGIGSTNGGYASGGGNGALTVDMRNSGDSSGAARGAESVGVCGETAMLSTELPKLEGLRRTGDRVSVCGSGGGNSVGVAESRAEAVGADNRPSGQRRPLRAREFAVRDSCRAGEQQARVRSVGVRSEAENATAREAGLHIRGTTGTGQAGIIGPADHRTSEAQGRTAETFDILNCGPRHRFVANGYIVHNSEKVNAQNLTRGGELRRAIMALPGRAIVACDSANIELRVNHTLAGQESSVTAFRLGTDLYCEFASLLYGREITDTPENKAERFLGKLSHLSLGYFCGWKKFQEICRQKGVILSDKRAREIVDLWRTVYSRIPEQWARLDEALKAMYHGSVMEIGKGLVLTFREEGVCGFWLPNNRRIRYYDLQPSADGWSYATRKGRRSIYSGKCDENICQALARHIIADQWMDFDRWLKANAPQWRVVLLVHDEIVATGPKEDAERVAAALTKIMSASPDWWPEIPLGAEAGIGERYGDAK